MKNEVKKFIKLKWFTCYSIIPLVLCMLPFVVDVNVVIQRLHEALGASIGRFLGVFGGAFAVLALLDSLEENESFKAIAKAFGLRLIFVIIGCVLIGFVLWILGR